MQLHLSPLKFIYWAEEVMSDFTVNSDGCQHLAKKISIASAKLQVACLPKYLPVAADWV